MFETKSRTLAGAALSLVVLAGLPAIAGEKLAVKAGRIVTRVGDDVTGGVIVIEGGKIKAVGAAGDVEAPWDAEVIDAPDLVAFPGFVEAHSYRGMDRSNENIDVAAFLDIRDSLDPVNFYFEDALRSGITTIGVQQGNACVIAGMGMVVRPWGMTVEEMMVKPRSGLKMSAQAKSGKSRATQAQALRTAFAELGIYLETLVEEKQDGNDRARREAMYQGRDLEGERAKGRPMGGSAWKVEGLDVVPRGEIDEKQEPLLDVVEGRVPVWFYCGHPAEVRIAIDVARTNGFLENTVLVLDDSCWKAADEIAAAGLPVVLSSSLMHIERDPVSGEEIETFVPGVFQKKGVRFALASAGGGTQSLGFQAALCVGRGLAREDALAAVTTTPAEMLGLADRVGSLAPGRDGNVVLFSGDPLGATAMVEYVILGGQVVYDRSKDVRAKHLLEGIEPKNTSPAGAEGEEVEVHEDEHGDEGGEKEGEESGGDEEEGDEQEGDGR
jgi:imidazolonepropionase-like amidohydrolase